MLTQIGEKIREFRLRDGRTQQETAKALGITPQAVSRWESGLSYPDVEMFPKIAEYFGVSIDRLYGRAIDERELEVERILDNIQKMRRDGVEPEAIRDVLADAVRQYPKEYRFMLRLCNVLRRLSRRNAEKDPELSLRYAFESAHWGEKILAETADNTLRCEAVEILKYIYTEHPEMSFKIDPLAESMPPLKICRENIRCYVTDRDDAFRNAQKFSHECLINIIHFTDWYKDPEERFRIKKAVLAMMKVYRPDGDFDTYWNFKFLLLAFECVRGELEHGCPDDAVALLEDILRQLETIRDRTPDDKNLYRYTSLSSRTLEPYTLNKPQIFDCAARCFRELPEIPDERYIHLRERFDKLCVGKS